MNGLDNLLEYIHQEIEKQKEKYNLEEINLELEELKENLELFDIDIERIDFNVIEKIFNEAYSPELSTKKIELFIDIIRLKDFLVAYQNESQIQTCLNSLNTFKELFREKIKKLENQLIEFKSNLSRELEVYYKYENYFSDTQLKRILTNEELENLIDFIINSDLDREVVSNLIMDITLNNIELYEKKKQQSNTEQINQIRKNAARISKLVDLETLELDEKSEELDENFDLEVVEPIENIEELLEVEMTLTDDEQGLYDEVFSIYEKLKQENFDTNSLKDLLELIDENDFGLSNVRSELYSVNSNLGNRWAIILLDLENNLLKNYKNNKEEIGIIFKHIIKIFKENYISKTDFLTNIKEIDNMKEITKFILYYDSLSDTDKNSLISIRTTIEEYGKESIEGFNISYNEFMYYTKIEELKEIIDLYNQRKNENIENERDLADILISELNSLNEQIISLLNEVKLYDLKNKEEKSKKEESPEIQPRENNVKSRNLIFLNQVFRDLDSFAKGKSELILAKKLYDALMGLISKDKLPLLTYACCADKKIMEYHISKCYAGAIRLFCRIINNNVIIVHIGIEGQATHDQFKNTIENRISLDPNNKTEYYNIINILESGKEKEINELLLTYSKRSDDFWNQYFTKVYNPSDKTGGENEKPVNK